MSITYSGDKITSTDGGSLNPLSAIFRNRLIDAGFTINQRTYVTNTALSSGTYAHDRWKAGSGGCTYTFTQGSLGVPITITITAGSLQQVIEGCNMPDGGTFTLSWTGTAQGRVNGGGYSTSPLIVTGLTAGANCTVEFNTGTLSFPQLEVGSSATGFEYRQYTNELALCQRYFISYGGNTAFELFGTGQASASSTSGYLVSYLPVEMRTIPSLGYSSVSAFLVNDANAQSATSALAINTFASTKVASVTLTTTGLTAGRALLILANNSTAARLTYSAEL